MRRIKAELILNFIKLIIISYQFFFLCSKRTYKYPHESLRKLPDKRVASEFVEESDGVEIDAGDELRSVTQERRTGHHTQGLSLI